jgi:hypothetical protein
MGVLLCLIFLLSLAAFPVFLVLLLISVARKKSKRTALLGLGLSLVFFLGSVAFYPTSTQTATKTAEPTLEPTPEPVETMVWIPTKGGTKYHSSSACSGMNGPEQVTVTMAEARGFSKCKKYW